jgi:hypothetical protein
VVLPPLAVLLKPAWVVHWVGYSVRLSANNWAAAQAQPLVLALAVRQAAQWARIVATEVKQLLVAGWARQAATCWAVASVVLTAAWSAQPSAVVQAAPWVTTWATKAATMVVAMAVATAATMAAMIVVITEAITVVVMPMVIANTGITITAAE